MRCVFCKANSDASISKEHILPESLGNVDHVLPPGWVCDKCNNYIALKIEKPFLETFYGQASRAMQEIPSKKGRIPPRIGFHPKSRTKIEMFRAKDGSGRCVGASEGEDENRWIQSILNMSKGEHGFFWMPDPGMPEANYTTSRFIAKIGFEALVFRGLKIQGWNDEIVDKLALDELRNYVRIGSTNEVWPISIRQIHPPDFLFTDIQHGNHQILHEFMLHFFPTASGEEYYAVIDIFGVEYAINFSSPELNGYQAWLKQNGDRSPLLEATPKD
jgi:hypothetical protein